MRDIILVTPAEYDLASIKRNLPAGANCLLDDVECRLVVALDGADDVVEFVSNKALSEYYDDPHEIELLSSMGSSPNFFIVHFKDIEHLKLVIISVANRPDVLVDNDFGQVESGDEFARRCKASPGWDWIQMGGV